MTMMKFLSQRPTHWLRESDFPSNVEIVKLDQKIEDAISRFEDTSFDWHNKPLEEAYKMLQEYQAIVRENGHSVYAQQIDEVRDGLQEVFTYFDAKYAEVCLSCVKEDMADLNTEEGDDE